MNVRLSKQQKIQVTGADEVFRIMRQILLRENKVSRNKEHFWTIGLANDLRILYIELVSLGSVNESIVNPSEVFQFAALKLAVQVILVHNHPSGNLEPSTEDKHLTDRLIQAGRLIHKEVVDHLIISTSTYCSFADDGLMDELRKSKRWVLRYEEEDRLRREGKEAGLKEGKETGLKEGKKTGRKEGPVSDRSSKSLDCPKLRSRN